MMLTVAICTHARPHDTLKCLRALIAQTAASQVSIIVIDNASPQADSQLLVREISALPGVQYVYEARPGLSIARNRACEVAAGDWIAYVDDDAIPHSDWLEVALRLTSSAADDVAIIGGTVVPLWPSQPHAGTVDPGRVGSYWRSLLSITDVEPTLAADSSMPNFVGCNMIIRRKTLNELGGFNVSLGRTPKSLLGGEEGELANRALARGMRTQFSRELIVQHSIHAERLTLRWLRARAEAEGQRLWFVAPSKRRLLKSAASLPALAYLSARETYGAGVINDNARLWRNIGYVRAGARRLRATSVR